MIDILALCAIITGTIILTYTITYWYVMPVKNWEREYIRDHERQRCAKVLHSWYNPMVSETEWFQRLNSRPR